MDRLLRSGLFVVVVPNIYKSCENNPSKEAKGVVVWVRLVLEMRVEFFISLKKCIGLVGKQAYIMEEKLILAIAIERERMMMTKIALCISNIRKDVNST
jgi:hypothetical protein